jgi:hypothetical protein
VFSLKEGAASAASVRTSRVTDVSPRLARTLSKSCDVFRRGKKLQHRRSRVKIMDSVCRSEGPADRQSYPKNEARRIVAGVSCEFFWKAQNVATNHRSGKCHSVFFTTTTSSFGASQNSCLDVTKPSTPHFTNSEPVGLLAD